MVRQTIDSFSRQNTAMHRPASSILLWAILVVCIGSSSHWAHASSQSDHITYRPGDDYLSEESTILITGAAGFLGSELALALYRTYRPKKILLVDRMNLGSHGASTRRGSSNNDDNEAANQQQQEDLALFEFQRQRAFHVLQTLGSTGQFFRVDFRPMIPEYYDDGEVPVLDHIFRDYGEDITHVVHLADMASMSSSRKGDMIIPREKEEAKAGMMDGILEQFVRQKRLGKRIPHFVYASSSEVYPKNCTIQKPPFDESKQISTPSSIRGASKLVDELLAKMYHDMHGIYSVGLRFFSVYGPWSVPGSPIFEMAERAVTGDKPILWQKDDDSQEQNVLNDLRDYVYIDDAIDAVMAAMQFRPPQPEQKSISEAPQPAPCLVINVATGKGSSLTQIAEIMKEYFPRGEDDNSAMNHEETDASITVSYGSTERAKALLGYQPHVTLRQGLEHTLAWHYDRAFPYGGQQKKGQDEERSGSTNVIAGKGIVSCLPYDTECLRAAPVFPCASECSHADQCTHSIFDSVIGWTQVLTAQCETVLYTIDLDESLTSLPSADIKINESSESFVKGKGACNLAFVSVTSELVQTLQQEWRRESYSSWGMLSMIFGSNWAQSPQSNDEHEKTKDKTTHIYNERRLIKHGKWALIPLVVPAFSSEQSNDFNIWKLLPKLSPGLFFAPSVQRAIYCDPDMLLESIPKLIQEASMQPYMENVQGATALLIGKGRPRGYFSESSLSASGKRSHDIILGSPPPDDQPPQRLQLTAASVQKAAYQMFRIAAWSSKLFGNSAGEGDGGGGSNHGFLTELLDSRWLVHTLQSEDSRLFRCDVLGEVVQWGVDSDHAAFEFIVGLHDMWSRVIAKQSGFDEPWWLGDSVATVPEGFKGAVLSKGRRLLEDVVDTNSKEDTEKQVVITEEEVEGDKKEEESNEEEEEEEPEEVVKKGDEINRDDDEVTKSSGEDGGETAAVGGGRFGMHTDEQDMQEVELNLLEDDDDDEVDDDEVSEELNEFEVRPVKATTTYINTDGGEYDTWMGVLSATPVKYFVRIVPSSEVGVMSLEEYNRATT